MAVTELVERLDHHVGVTGHAQPPGGLTKHSVLTPAFAGDQRRAPQAQEGPLLLESLPRRMNRLDRVDLDPVAELLDRAVELFAGAAAKSRLHRFAVLESGGHR